ncbi:hypothetical protein [Desulfatiglans anilini]|uniref:hypothetical protein n=1 Tax=Desulfatiglans anilini TaxID=90728 RepID=UPI0003F9B06D|nr:hypothetical protein [Desulfatiglans anilini]
MWLFTVDGFFSVVKDNYCSDAELMVRARVREDLERFCKRMAIDPGGILELPEADYRFRIKVRRGRWVAYAGSMAYEIEYSNFKNTVDDHRRHMAYMECWRALHDWQEAQTENKA